MTILQRLKTETESLHQQTEEQLYSEAIRNGTLTLAQYAHLLQIHYRFHQSLERTITLHNDFFADYNAPQRRKVPTIVADAQTIGLTLSTDNPDYFADWSEMALLGAAYVAEGSMLGGRLISHYLAQNPALTAHIGQSHFYVGYGDQTGILWRAFGEFLIEKAENQQEIVINGAKQAFSLYNQLFTTFTIVSSQLLNDDYKAPDNSSFR